MARARLLETDTVTLEELLSNGKLFRVPPFQRDYSWDEEQWEALWDDLVESGARSLPHYMGTLVLQRDPGGPTLVIDGQQRLATLIILCVAVLKRLAAMGQTQRFELLRARYVGSPDPGSLRWQSKLTLNQDDDGFFQQFIVNLKQPPAPARLRGSTRRLWRALEYFERRLASQVPGDDAEALVGFFQGTAGTRLAFTTITVDDELNAYSVFETLNARSLQLTSTDLLKNYLFSLLSGGKVDLEQGQQQWTRIVQTVDAESLPDLLRQYIASKVKLVRAEALFRAVRKEVGSREAAFSLLDSLEQAAGFYAALGDPQDELWSGSRECSTLVRLLNLVGARQHVPLLLACLMRGFDLARVHSVLDACFVVMLRHLVVGRRNPSELERRFNELAIGVSSGALKNPRAIWLGHDGAGGLREAYVADEDFRHDFARLELPGGRSAKVKQTRYLLLRLDQHLGGPGGDFETSTATLEHVLPQNPGQGWANFSEEDRRRLTERLGNHVLLDRQPNRELANRPFGAKVEVYRRSAYPTTTMVSQLADWTPAAIDERQMKLADAAVHVWKVSLG